MKKLGLLIIAVFGSLTCIAQGPAQMVYQPTHVTAKRINADGVVTAALALDFSYSADGKLSSYESPDYSNHASYYYSGDYITQESIFHGGGQPVYFENNYFTYEDGRLKTVFHLIDQIGVNQYWVYSYYDDGRLERIDYRDEFYDYFPEQWLYDYEDEGKTVVESYYTSYVTQGTLLRERTTSHHDDSYNLTSKLIEKFNTSGEPTSTESIDYQYTENGSLEECTTMVLENGLWVNSKITRYSYDSENRVSEKIDGSWDTEQNEWKYTGKITYEFLDESQTQVVSFYKKSNGQWVRDVYDNYDTKPIFFDTYLKAQQRALGCFVYDYTYGEGNINQFEIAMEATPEPVYLDNKETTAQPVDVYPNPTKGTVTISGDNLKQADLYNAIGQRVASVQGQGETLQIDIANLPSGIYFVNVTDSEGRKCVKKVVKQ